MIRWRVQDVENCKGLELIAFLTDREKSCFVSNRSNCEIRWPNRHFRFAPMVAVSRCYSITLSAVVSNASDRGQTQGALPCNVCCPIGLEFKMLSSVAIATNHYFAALCDS